MRKFFTRLIIMTVALTTLGFVAFAYVGDLSPTRSEVTEEVTLTLN